MKVHPIAEMFPMMTEEELDDLAADIKTNGLLNPIIKDKDGVLIDGRNRLEACRRAEIEPTFETLDGQDPVAFILSNNVHRRHLSKGQQAMAVAFVHPEAERGRGKKDPAKKVPESGSFGRERLRQARQVLRHSRELAIAVLRGPPMTLDNALEQVIAAQKELESDEGKLAALREEAPDLADLVAEERLPLDEAYATFEKRKHDAEEKEKSQRETICRVAEDSYRMIIAWSVDEFCNGVKDRLEDKEFCENFIKRIRLNRAEIPSIIEGAKSLTEILNKL